MINGMKDPVLEVAVTPLRQFLFRNRNLNNDEKLEAYRLMLDLVVDIVQFTNHKNLKQVRSTFSK